MQWGVFTFIGFTFIGGFLLLSLPVSNGAWKGKSDSPYVCLLPMDTGPCKALLHRYYFNRLIQKCQMFPYGGCKGNENNFESQKECRSRCGRFIPTEISSKCTLPRERGICRAFLRRYFYNIKTGMCERFVYGGCDGNANNFNDLYSCQLECNPSLLVPSFCKKPKDRGACKADIPRLYFNPNAYRCEKFSYTGCGGNDNNFSTLKACRKICRPRARKQLKKKPITAVKY
ncbi:tissue factor pathway inhibitor 2 isoform X2 [Amblyraja radiata]|uniref:tissue factor pathway inhibitor 2 isoform X2 n=1 Tax=Amblyraja radiata TaxID=386614 RepID=UPI0014023A32|nr:tissue factor pathway inhibitor 2 isoform X2 [Amblyraja radiata]